MDDYKTKLISDLPDQFKDSKNIEVLMAAIGRQLDDLKQFFDDLNVKRWLDTAEGVQLDRIGEILGINRKEALDIVSSKVTEMDDETYRLVLKYKVALNTSNATYRDIITAMKLIWGEGEVTYSEDPARPATILMVFPNQDIYEEDRTIGRILKIKAAGVGILWMINYYGEFDESELEKINLTHVEYHMALPMWNFRLLDGSWLLDGTYLLNAIRKPMPLAIARHSQLPVSNSEHIGDVSILTKSDNFWLLNGDVMLDGSQMLNAFYYKEEVE